MLETPEVILEAPTSSLNSVLVRSVMAAALGGLLFGFDTVVVSGTNEPLRKAFHLSEIWVGVIDSSALWAAILGALMSGLIADRLGRISGLRLSGWLFLVSGLGCALAWSFPPIIVFRACGGFAVGASWILCPMYIAEISPAPWRGRMVMIFQTFNVFGILLAYLSNAAISLLRLGATEWRWKFGAEALPDLLFLLLLAAAVQSPRWLVKKDREPEARDALGKLGERDVEGRLAEIRDSLVGRHTDRLFQKKYTKPILLGMLIAVLCNFSGITAVLYYVNDLFQKAGFGASASNNGAVFVGFMNFIATVAALFLIDKLGRKPLLLFGAAVMAPALAGIGIVVRTHQHQGLLIWMVGAYIVAFAISLGSVICVYLSEIVPNSIRGKGESLSGGIAMTGGALLTLFIPVWFERIGYAGTYSIFAAVTGLGFFIVLFYFPETKGVTLEEMQLRLGITDASAERSANDAFEASGSGSI
jgi:sugar porter (SP) family MFS transporter